MKEKLIFAFHSGHSTDAYKLFGAHFTEIDGIKGVLFCVYAPNAHQVQVVGDFNNWNGVEHIMKREYNGIYTLFIPDLKDYDAYKYRIIDKNYNYIDKADPYAYYSEYRPRDASKVYNLEGFPWMDGDWIKKRTKNYDKPMSIYEVHFGSWQKKPNGDYYSYEEMADRLIPYVKERGYTHIEILPLLEHPFDGSWGYQCTGYFNVTSRYGNPKQLMYFIDQCHQNGIGVIMDFVPVHFVKDEFGLHNFDGSPLYEYANLRNRYSEWGTVNFDLEKEEVRSFLISSASFWLEYFHFDGIRVDAVSNIIYWGGNSDRGVNYSAVDFIKRFNSRNIIK
jgi:1,4-alpha-glucan branching enzyme